MTDRRQYVGGANKVQLTGPVIDSTLALPVTTLSSWPVGVGRFLIAIDRGTNQMEKCWALAAGAGTITIDPSGRGVDGTSKLGHDTGAWVEVVLGAIDADEANAHVVATEGVHGIPAGDRLVGRASVDTFTNKTIDGALNNIFGLEIASMPDQAQVNTDTAAHLALHDTQIADTYTEAEVNNLITTVNSTHYTKTEADTLLAAETAARTAADLLAAPQATTYTKTEVDTRLDLKVDDSQLVWAPYTPTFLGATSGGTLGNATVIARFSHVGTSVRAMLDITIGSSSNLGVGALLIGLPVPAAVATGTHLGGGMIFDASAGAAGRFTVNARLNSVNDLLLVVVTTMGIVTGSGTVPMSWAAGDLISIQIDYEAAS